MNVRRLLLMAVCWLPAMAHATELTEISVDDYHGYAYFKGALDFEQVAKLEDRSQQLRVVARDMGWSTKKLAAAVEKVETLGDEPTELAEKAARTALEGSRVKKRILDLSVDGSEPSHVVAYVRLRGSSSGDVLKDAASVAHTIHKSAPFVSTASLCIVHTFGSKDPESPRGACVWSGKIGRSSMARINEARIPYAERLYKSIFEEVKETKVAGLPPF